MKKYGVMSIIMTICLSIDGVSLIDKQFNGDQITNMDLVTLVIVATSLII